MTTEEKIEEFRKALKEELEGAKCSFCAEILKRFESLFPPPEPRKCWVIFYEVYNDVRDEWRKSFVSDTSKGRMELEHGELLRHKDVRNVSRIIEVSE